MPGRSGVSKLGRDRDYPFPHEPDTGQIGSIRNRSVPVGDAESCRLTHPAEQLIHVLAGRTRIQGTDHGLLYFVVVAPDRFAVAPQHIQLSRQLRAGNRLQAWAY